MLFLGTTFFSGLHTLDPPAVSVSPITEIKLTNGTFDHLYASKNSEETIESTHNEWNENTLLSAPFDDSLDAGNSGFSLRNTDIMVVKCREKGSIDWKTIHTKEIKTIDDFKMFYFYRYARSNTDYEFMLASTCNGIENSRVIREVHSDFNGFFVVNQDNAIGTIYTLDGCDITRTASGEAATLLNSQYAKVIHNGAYNYDTGTATGAFLKTDARDCFADLPGSLSLRKDMMDFLTDKKPKILKWEDGRIWMIDVVGTPTDTMDSHPDLRKITFQFAEIGDVNDPKALYTNGLSPIGPEWW